MDQLTRKDLDELIEYSSFPSLSLYMPTHRVTAHTEQDRIRLKNLIQQAQQRLAGKLRTPEIRDLLAPVQQLYDDALFWQRQSEGLAAFLASGFTRHYCLPRSFGELLVVSDRFHIRPLLPLLTGDGRFYILAISQDHVRLLEATRDLSVEVELPEMPRSLAEAMRYDDPEKQLQFHTKTAIRGPTPVRAAAYHGQGQAHGEDPKNRLLRFFRQVDSGLQPVIRNGHVPLVLAADDYYVPIFRQANTYPYLVEVAITGSPERVSEKELHRRGWAIVEPLFRVEQQDAEALFQQVAGTDRASTDVKEIVPAASQGRVQHLFVPLGQQMWGTFDPAHAAVEPHAEPQSKDYDLLDLAAAKSWSSGASVFALRPDAMPAGASIAAVYRY